MRRKVCVFTGAGISVPLGLPTTSGFEVTLNKIHANLRAQINSFYKGSEARDIEKILYLLEDFVRQKDFSTHIVKQGGDDTNFRIVRENLMTYKAWAEEAIEQIKADIYDLLEDYDLKKASQLYSSLIGEIKDELGDGTAISFFTTNYDLTFENGFADSIEDLNAVGIQEVYYGFGGARNGKAQYNPEEDFNWTPEILEYKKLHGSLDWNLDKGKNCVRSGAAIIPRSPSKMPMLYPGFKGTPTNKPFVDLHERLDKRLNEADLIFVLGFAFRDEYINNIFDYSLKRNKNATVLCYNPSELKNMPTDSRMSYFVNKYSNRFHHIPIGIELKPKPLKLQYYIAKTKPILNLTLNA